ncbi:MAG TPA: 2-oxoacid:acceptor oxidoreductase subunit alpha [Fimbriimonadaceae bacterium]|nr:2-oxoacid:acceptor oxidoreductase subunit alpha [Fimbriimonadaceae bacterium]
MSTVRLVQGNEACAFGALYAGCTFYSGYPITPSSEIMEILAQELPKRGGTFIQMEDEIASVCTMIGAAWGGSKAMTATSGPGFSLMQEGLGYASITETPCVLVDCMRWGPSTGQPTKTGQGDVMQAIWGTHGDHAVIVLTASNVREVFEMTVTAFNYAEKYRVPVVLLLDEVLGHMREKIDWPDPGELAVVERKRPANSAAFKPFGAEEFLAFGEGARMNVTGMAHGETGFPVQGEAAAKQLYRMMSKVQDDVENLSIYRADQVEDARVLVVSYGITARAAESAVAELRAEGVAAGLLDLKTLWPFPDFLFQRGLEGVDLIVVPELNLGQISREVERAVAGRCRVQHLGRIDGYLLTPEEIRDAVQNGLGQEAREFELTPKG